MSIRFAGSRHVHERRRRRLAQESDASAGVTAQPVARATSADTPRLVDGHDSYENSPLHSVIRPQIWIHWCIVALCLGCWGGLLYVGDLAEQTDFGLRDILGIRSGRLVNFFSTIMLLWAGQLALLIYWFRRKSRNDFHGRYRMWLWVGVTLQLFLAVVATEAHLPFSEYMQRVWPMSLPRYDLLSWLIPVATISLALFKLLSMEMRNSRCSRALLWIAAVAGLVSALSLLGGTLLPERIRDFVQVGSATLAHLGLATSLLLHARYVIHISNEAPPATSRTSLVARCHKWQEMMPRLSLPSLKLPKLRLPKRKPRLKAPKTEKAPHAKAGEKSSSTAKRKSQSVKGRPAQRANTVVSAKTSAGATASPNRRVDESEPPKGPKASQPAGDGQAGERGGDDLRGLSKKERRRLRKQQGKQNQASDSAR